MKRREPRTVCLHRAFAALLFACLAASPAWAARVVVFGDSWGVPAASALAQVMAERGLPDTTYNAATGGETAANLAGPVGLAQITNALAANPDCDLIHLSIGGNDFLGSWNAGLSQAQVDALVAQVRADVETIVDHILTERPAAAILWSSYDYPRPLPLGTPTEVNAASAYFIADAQTLADSKGASLTYIDFSGLMQVTYGFDGVQYSPYDPAVPIPPGNPSLPDPTLPSPQAAFTDSIHLTADGYRVLANEQYDAFYIAFLEGAAPVPALGPFAHGTLVIGLLAGGLARVRRLA